jgi:hypothetical protein
MRIKMVVSQDRPNEYEHKKRGTVHERILTLMDQDECAGQVVPGSFDYVLTEAEMAQFPRGALDNKTLVIGVRDIVEWNGRPRFRGVIDVPASGLGNTTSASAAKR